MRWRPIVADDTDLRADVKEAISFGSFRLSERAVYLKEREYLPLRVVTEARLYASRLNAIGCCGLGVPVWYVLLYYGGERPLKLLGESKEKAEKILEEIRKRNPQIMLREE